MTEENIYSRIAEKFLDKFEKLNEKERRAYDELLEWLSKPIIIIKKENSK